jgi:hypothetical protein
MCIEAVVGLPDQFPIEAPFANTGFVASDEEDGSPSRVESECHTPLTICRAETKLLHIRIPGALQRIDSRPTQSRPEPLQEACQRQNFRPHVFFEREKFRTEFVADLDSPAHTPQYDMKLI